MRAGIVILTEDRWWSGEPKWRNAEEFGFDHAWTYDHLNWRSLADGPWFSALPTLTAAAMVTETIMLGTFVASPNYRHPVPFMRELITLDDISDGRLLLGLGAGVSECGAGDRAMLGEQDWSPAALSDRFGEFVEALDGALTKDNYSFDGTYFRASGSRNLPGCVQMPRIPFAIAANGPRSLGIAARYGQGWITTGRPSDDNEQWWRGVAELSEQFDRALDDAGRDPARVRRYLSLDAGPVYSLTSVDTFTDAAQRARKLGFTDIVVHWPRATDPYCGREAVLERIAEEVLAEVQEL
ncbi:LLM class flavin-dependent oxidoreductase [Haloechinothrix halophila]|uniref:LLM class flavin-dependent oxidoreductase n=1 Tax=Haloechinothrix halophila TaxID=1069073 RepID=UPI0004147528|nr:LLM class flavin-dependent oxidoreductase [Haloechinothrix halophila]